MYLDVCVIYAFGMITMRNDIHKGPIVYGSKSYYHRLVTGLGTFCPTIYLSEKRAKKTRKNINEKLDKYVCLY